jgi:hypothetical protein
VRRDARAPSSRGAGRGLTAIVVALLCAAPVPGDIGACGQPVQKLDADRFFLAKVGVDCEQCTTCGLRTKRCELACKSETTGPASFPEGCVPLVHDGEVCLRRLLASDCDDYGRYVDDSNPTVPSECNFCPVGAQ